MHNGRKIDKFWLSGGWQNLPNDVRAVANTKIKAVLDLQFTPADEIGPAAAVKLALAELGIDYEFIPMWDGNLGQDIEEIFSNSNKILQEFEIRYPEPRQFILVKCAGGISRSSSVLIAHYCETRKMTYTEALAYIHKQERFHHSPADPNPVFSRYLRKKYGN